MAQSGKSSGAANPPFATKDGSPANQGATSKGGHDFNQDPKSGSMTGAGRDFTKENRPQSEAKAEVVPNPQEIPTGGKILKADPGPVSAKVSGPAESPTQQKTPFKGLKG